MPKDLRTFLQEWELKHPEDILRIEKPISAKFELTALQKKLSDKGKHPVIICERPRKVDGTISDFKLVANLTASREICASVIGLNPRRVAIEYAQKAALKIEPEIIKPQDAPVKEVVQKGKDIDLYKFPITIQHYMNPGPYLTAAYVCTYDPDTGGDGKPPVDNCALQRCWVKKKDRTGLLAMPTSHNLMNIWKHWRKGQDMPVAMWIGHHPAAVIGSQTKLPYPESHYWSASGLIGEPLRLVPTETFGRDLLVPADCEIVVEGYVRQGVWEAEGPFGEYTGYTGPQKPGPVIDVTCVTHRRDAIYHDFATGLPDMLVMDNFAIEARIYDMAKRVVPEVINVHVPISGHRFNAYVQLSETRPGIGKDTILAALVAYPRVKHIIVVNADIDIFDDSQIMWAIGTRTQWDKDLVIIPGMAVSTLDPSTAEPKSVGCKGGIDATLPPPPEPGMPHFYHIVNTIPEDIDAKVRVEDYATEDQIARFPGTF